MWFLIILFFVGCNVVEVEKLDASILVEIDAGTDTIADAGTGDAGNDTGCNECNEPPTDKCISDTCFYEYDDKGTCVDGACEYKFKRRCCYELCQDGRCVHDCDTFVCDSPPDNHCNGKNEFVKYDKIGECNNGFCFHSSEVIECAGDCTQNGC